MLLCTAYTCANVPYNALLPELTRDFDERTALTGYKSMFAVVGTLAAPAPPCPLSMLSDRAMDSWHGGPVRFAHRISVLVPSSVFASGTREAGDAAEHLASNLTAFRNRPFLLILGAWTFNTIGMTVVTATLVYYFKYQFNDAR